MCFLEIKGSVLPLVFCSDCFPGHAAHVVLMRMLLLQLVNRKESSGFT